MTVLKSYGATTNAEMMKSQSKMTYSAVKAALDDRILTEDEREERAEKLGF